MTTPLRSAPEQTSTPEAQPAPPMATSCHRRWRSTELLGQQQEIEIEHGLAVYRLRLTSLGKLILTK
jgi:hemin uptake protein HemP